MKDEIVWANNYPNIVNIVTDLENDERISFSKLCRNEFSDEIKLIADKLNSKNARQIIFHIKQRTLDIPICKCGVSLAWHPDLREYRKYCSKSCTAIFSVELIKQTNLASFGKEWHSQLPEWKDKVKKTSLAKFGVDHYSKTIQCKEQVIITNLEKYNVSHVMQLASTKKKVIETNLAKYGVDNPLKNSIIQDKVKTTNLARYGVSNPINNSIIQDKVKTTNLARYGSISPLGNKKIRAKCSVTTRLNYYDDVTFEKINNVDWLTTEHTDGKTIGEIANDIGVSSSNLGKIFHSLNIDVIRHPRSALEKKLHAYFHSQNIQGVHNVRDIISPRELDLFFPDKKIAIEVNGCYYHSEKFDKHDQYHLSKTNDCNDIGIELLQFWDFELNDRWPQVINLINSKLGIGDRTYARKTSVKILSYSEKKKFIERNHLQGDVSSSVNLGLIDNNDQLIMVATFGKPRFTKKENMHELLRLCSLDGTQVVGGASKLMKHFIKTYMNINDTLISYCNRRYSIGNVYNKLGFELESVSPPGFFYINKQGNYAGSRYQWQKHLMKDKLVNFNPGLTAQQNMKNHGYNRVWDCGQYVFQLRKT